MKQELICIVCPKGCHLTAEQTAEGWQIAGYGCPRGQQYGVAEMTNPTRVVTSTVRCEGGAYPRCPVKTSGPIPKSEIFAAVALLDGVTLTAPVQVGQVVVENVCGTGVDFVATRSM